VAIAAALTLLACVFIFLPLAIFRATRFVSVYGLLFSSYVFGLCVWLVGLLDAYDYWGLGGVVIGMFMAGAGVVPIAMLGQALHSQWSEVAIMIGGIVLTYGTRMFSFWLADTI
jgi:hypothetical protein